MERDEMLAAIEKREGQLWLLAFFLIFLLAVSLFIVDFALPSADNDYSQLIPVGQLLSSNAVRATLILMVLLIFAYFREKVQALHKANRQLISSLSYNESSLLAQAQQLEHWQLTSRPLCLAGECERLHQLIMEAALQLVSAQSGCLMLLDDSGQQLEVVADHGSSASVHQHLRLKVGEGIAGYVVSKHRPVLIKDGETSKELDKLLAGRPAIGSVLCAPLDLGDQVVGAITVNRRPSARSMDAHDLYVLSAFARQAALALENARLHGEASERDGERQSILAQLQQVQDELCDLQRLASLGLVTVGAAHELGDVVNVILGRAEVLMTALSEDPHHKHLEVIREQSRRITDLADHLVRLSQEAGPAAPQPVDPNQVVRDTLKLTAAALEGKGVRVAADLADRPLAVVGSQVQLQQAITSLLVHACHHLPDGGELAVRTWQEGESIYIAVAENGADTSPEHLQCMLGPSCSGQASQDSGLGLALSQRLVSSHGGRFRAENDAGKGMVYVVELPALPEAQVS